MPINPKQIEPNVISNKKSKLLSDDKGFTLIEIIAVLVILGILAAVAIPRYFDLQEEAQDKALAAAMGEAVGRMNQYFAEQVLKGVKPDTIDYSGDVLGSDMGDFTLTVIAGGQPGDSTITLQVQGDPDGTLAGATKQKTIPMPRI